MAKRRGGKVRNLSSGPGGRWVNAMVEPACRSLLRSARDLLALDDPLQAELWGSETVGIWFGLSPIAGDPHRIVGEPLVRKVGQRQSPEALALLLALAAVAPPGLADQAGGAARKLEAAGLRAPAWAAEAGRATVVRAWMAGDPFGDQDAVFVAFRHGSRPAHTLVALVDHTLGDMVKDAFMAGPPKTVLDDWNWRSSLVPEPVGVPWAVATLALGLEARGSRADPPSSREFVQVEALLTARLRGLGAEVPSAGAATGAANPVRA